MWTPIVDKGDGGIMAGGINTVASSLAICYDQAGIE
jgi:hypothetical protein